MRSIFGFFILIALAGGGAYYYMNQYAAEPTTSFRTAQVKQGDLSATISATGTVEPEEVVDVGAQVAGKINTLGVDPLRSTPTDPKSIDYGSVVEENTVLARIDDSLYKAQLDQAQASLRRAQADLEQMKAKLAQAENDWKRAKSLLPTKAIADSDYDIAVANYQVAKANVGVGEAAIEQNRAMLNLAETNLSYTIIKSPVRGVIIDRRVNIGQTVVASLNAPSLFLIAKDLRRMQVWASVNEADIGRIHVGLPVRFTVDTYPNETFLGKVAQIRLNATMTQNVVTYTVVVETGNADLKLLPYLTANLQFEIDQHKDVLLVPNAALRWKPRPQLVAPDVRESVSSLLSGKAGKEGRGKDGGGRSKDKAKASDDPQAVKPAKDRVEQGRLWARDGAFVRPIAVQIGATDGTMTEVSGSDLKEGTDVVIGENVADSGGGDTTNPFAPKLFKRNATKAKE